MKGSAEEREDEKYPTTAPIRPGLCYGYRLQCLGSGFAAEHYIESMNCVRKPLSKSKGFSD